MEKQVGVNKINSFVFNLGIKKLIRYFRKEIISPFFISIQVI